MPMRVNYVLDDQVGYVLRRVTQRHLSIFSEAIPAVTTTQWAVMARLAEEGPQSQNMVGRATAMDAATVKGVVDRLVRQGLVATQADPDDRRRLIVSLTAEGKAMVEKAAPAALKVSDLTLEPLSQTERDQLLQLLRKLT